MAHSADSADDETKRNRRPGVKRGRLWFRIHSFIGLNLSLLLGFVFLLGTLSVFSSEIDWLLKPQIRASALVPADDLPWEAIATSLAEHAPGSMVDTIEAGMSPIFAPAAYLHRPDGGLRIVYFDRETGAVQGEGSMLSAKSFLRAAHSRLFLPEQLGTTLVSSLSVFLSISLITAMLIHKKWWRGFLKLPGSNRGGRIFWGDVHRLAGVWVLAFGPITALTGIWYLAEEVAVPAPVFASAPGTDSKVMNGEAAALLPAALATARGAYPELHIRRIVWPGANGGAFGFYGQDGTILVRPRANGILVDAFGDEIIDRHSGNDGSLHQRISEAADPLHTGSFGGYWSRSLWFLFGVVMTVLAFSGATIFVKRLARDGGNISAAADDATGRWGWLRLSNGLGVGVILVISAIGTLLFLLPGTIAALQ